MGFHFAIHDETGLPYVNPLVRLLSPYSLFQPASQFECKTPKLSAHMHVWPIVLFPFNLKSHSLILVVKIKSTIFQVE